MCGVTREDLDRLAAPFPANKIHWRVGSTTQDKKRGMALAYIDARDARARLNEVCGPENWTPSYVVCPSRVTCSIAIRFRRDDGSVEWLSKEDGAGDTDVEGDKGAYSAAFKRAAAVWQIGEYLYGLDSPWVELEPRGRSYSYKASEQPKLDRVLEKAGLIPPQSAPTPKAPAPAPEPQAPAPEPRQAEPDARSKLYREITDCRDTLGWTGEQLRELVRSQFSGCSSANKLSIEELETLVNGLQALVRDRSTGEQRREEQCA